MSKMPTLALLFEILITFLPLGLSYTPLSNATLQSIPRPGPDFDIHTGPILSPLLQPRVPGTPGSEAVRHHITDFFKSALPSWSVEYQNTSSQVPIPGSPKTPFTNIIVSRDPPGHNPKNIGRLTLAAHYDSLREPDGFIGAIDSAAPCGILMYMAQSIDAALTQKWSTAADNATEEAFGIQILFLDGEEMFGNTLLPNDGLYGSRALAAHWAVDSYPDHAKYESRLDAIEVFVLLDLLGAKGPTVPSFYPFTHAEYQRVAALEYRIREMGRFFSQSGSSGLEESWFVDRGRDARNLTAKGVEDDQVPFSALGVAALHIIDVDPETGEFPSVWHTMDDDGEHLDLDTVGDWTVLMTAFVAEWLGLEGHLV